MTLRDRLDGFNWRSTCELDLGGESLWFDADSGRSPSEEQVYVFKTRSVFETYAEVLDGAPSDRVMELGIWKGGSALMFAELLQPHKLVVIDIEPPIAVFERFRVRDEYRDRIVAHYNTSQDDEAKLGAIVDAEFDGVLDIVIDDASHHYGLSKSSFEILFPRLAPGGWYVIEDWGWGHIEKPLWPEEPSLAGLIFELQLALFCNPKLIHQVVVRRDMVFVQKSHAASAKRQRLSLDDLYILHHRSRPLVA